MRELPRRTAAARNLIAAVESGSPVPTGKENTVRIIVPHEPHPGSERCIVCDARLIGRQQRLCAGHWDYLVVPPAATANTEQFVAWLTTVTDRLRVEHYQRFWMAVMKGHSRCEICDVPTSNVERLVSGDSTPVKTHTVCPSHQTFRDPEPAW